MIKPGPVSTDPSGPPLPTWLRIPDIPGARFKGHSVLLPRVGHREPCGAPWLKQVQQLCLGLTLPGHPRQCSPSFFAQGCA